MTVERVGVFPQTTLTLKKAIPNRLAQSQRLPVMESVRVGLGVPKRKFQNFSKAQAAQASVL